MTTTSMNGIVTQALPNLVGFDQATVVTAQAAAGRYEKGFRFCVRYVSLGDTEDARDLSTAEVNTLLGAGLALMPVQHATWEPWTADWGRKHGGRAAAHALAIGLPAGMTVWLDLERDEKHDHDNGYVPTPDEAIEYASAWYDEVAKAGFVPGVYIGAGCPLSSSQLYKSLEFQHYWRSASNVPDVEKRGYQLFQSLQTSDSYGVYDPDRTQDDNLGGEVIWLAPGEISYPVLKQGAKGPAVGALQVGLVAAGADDLHVDDDFGTCTYKAVEDFQRQRGLPVDGIADAATWAALSSATTGAKPAPEPDSVPAPSPIPTTSAHLMPNTLAINRVFSRVLGLVTPYDGEDLTAEIAGLLGAPPTRNAPAITPGDLASIAAALQGLLDQPGSGNAAPRLSALKSFYQTQAALGPSQRASKSRLFAVSAGISLIGTVRSSISKVDPEDPAGLTKARSGWIRLNEIFGTAYGNSAYGVSNVRTPGAAIPAWCGLFALWAIKATGAAVGTWKPGFGIGSVAGFNQIPKGIPILPGDVAVLNSYQHHCVVITPGDTFESVDGNYTFAGVAGSIGTTHHDVDDTVGFWRVAGW